MRMLAALLLAAAACGQRPAAPPLAARLERMLLGNILAFWHPQTLDTVHGGYRLNHDARGAWMGDAPKALVTQARLVWFFARMARAGHGDRRKMLDAAEHGYRFLMERMRDPRHGGYREFLQEDWMLPPADENGYMGVGPDWKLMNTHLHLMEAMTSFWRASALPLARERLMELIQIEGSAVVRHPWGACSDRNRLDWTPVLEGRGGRASYGHDLENIWLLEDALRAAGLPVDPWLGLFRHSFVYSMRFGCDGRNGGFWDWGVLGKPAESRVKIWWVQAEALVSALTMHRLTGERQYRDVFERTWQFIESHMADRENGEWHAQVDEKLNPGGRKAHEWKGPYHNGRAMIECLALLRGLPWN